MTRLSNQTIISFIKRPLSSVSTNIVEKILWIEIYHVIFIRINFLRMSSFYQSLDYHIKPLSAFEKPIETVFRKKYFCAI